MANSVYQVNKGINRSVEFKGLKAQYIWLLGGGLVVLLVLFAILYIVGVNVFVCLLIISVLGGGLFWIVYRMSNRYGEHGLMKASARRAAPRVLRVCSRKVFFKRSDYVGGR